MALKTMNFCIPLLKIIDQSIHYDGGFQDDYLNSLEEEEEYTIERHALTSSPPKLNMEQIEEDRMESITKLIDN